MRGVGHIAATVGRPGRRRGPRHRIRVAAPVPSGEGASQLALQEATQMERFYIDDALGTGVR